MVLQGILNSQVAGDFFLRVEINLKCIFDQKQILIKRVISFGNPRMWTVNFVYLFDVMYLKKRIGKISNG